MKRQQGFGLVGVLIVILVLGLISFSGWYVISARHKTSTTSKTLQTTDANNTKNTRPSSPASKTNFVLPSGWRWYENKDLGFKFAYPELWGQLSTADSGSLLLNLYSEEYTDNTSQIQGRVNLTVRDKTSFELSPEKYSVTLKPLENGTEWQITDVNPVVADKYKVGDMYDLKGKREVDGGSIYALSHSDEGCTMNRYVLLLKSGYGELNTPALCSQTTISTSNTAAFEKISHNIISSISIF